MIDDDTSDILHAHSQADASPTPNNVQNETETTLLSDYQIMGIISCLQKE